MIWRWPPSRTGRRRQPASSTQPRTTRPRGPLDRLLGYVDFRAASLTGELPEYTCLLGTLVQETYDTHPEIRSACERALSAHTAELTRDVEAAGQLYAPAAPWSAESVGNFIQAVLQGSFILAKAKQGPEVVRENLEHLRRTLRALFQPDSYSGQRGSATRRPLIPSQWRRRWQNSKWRRSTTASEATSSTETGASILQRVPIPARRPCAAKA